MLTKLHIYMYNSDFFSNYFSHVVVTQNILIIEAKNFSKLQILLLLIHNAILKIFILILSYLTLS